jgi:hypothetical protein
MKRVRGGGWSGDVKGGEPLTPCVGDGGGVYGGASVGEGWIFGSMFVDLRFFRKFKV